MSPFEESNYEPAMMGQWPLLHEVLLVHNLHDRRSKFTLGDTTSFLEAVVDIHRVWGLFNGNHGLDKHKGYEIICKLHALGKHFHGFHQFISRPGVAYDEGRNKVSVSLDLITTDTRENPEAVDYVLRGQPEYTKLREIFIDERVSGVDWRSCFDCLHGRGL